VWERRTHIMKKNIKVLNPVQQNKQNCAKLCRVPNDKPGQSLLGGYLACPVGAESGSKNLSPSLIHASLPMEKHYAKYFMNIKHT
jgi:hypothetical protein